MVSPRSASPAPSGPPVASAQRLSRPADVTYTQVRGHSIAPWAYLGANVPLVAVIFLLPQYHVYLWGLLGLGSVAAIVVGVARNRPGHALAWFCVASRRLDIRIRRHHLRRPDRVPSPVQPFPVSRRCLLHGTYPLLGCRADRRWSAHAGAATATRARCWTPSSSPSGLAVLSWIYLIQPYVRADDMTPAPKMISIAYPLGDILILCVLVRLVFGGETRNTSRASLDDGRRWACSLADCAYGWIQLHGSWKVGGPTDLGWVLFYVCWGAAALHPAMRELTVEQPRRPQPSQPRHSCTVERRRAGRARCS